MPDTKSGRERKGRNKMAQLITRLNEREIETLGRDDEPPDLDELDGEFIADEPAKDV
jgi:hypothetical protein